MHQENSQEQVSMTTEEQQTRTTNSIRAKSADYPRTATPLIASFKTRPSSIYIDEVHRREEEEERELKLLNNRFANHLDKIKTLGDRNNYLRHQIDEIYQKSIGQEPQNSSEIELNNLRQQLNGELQKSISLQIRFQRADYDKKYYKTKCKYFSTTHQIPIIQQQLDANLYQLNLIKEQYQKQKQNLQSYRMQYNEYMTKLIEYTNEYNKITFERIENENCLYTLKEQISFEREYNYQCKQEFKYLEKIQYDSNNQFDKNELENTIKKIREDYQKYNQIQLYEYELLYQIKLESIEMNFHQDKIENPSEEIKENQLLEQKLKQLENDFQHIIEENHQQYELLNNEYHQLEIQLPEFESFIQISRNNTVDLKFEINTYRCLLINLVQKRKTKPNDFIVHFGNGVIWVRI